MVPWYVTLVRTIIPFSILRWPLIGIILSSLADMYDWKFVTIRPKTNDFLFYQNWDKVMDLYYWIFALIIVFRWKEKRAQIIAVFLFVYRVLGTILFWITGIEKMLFYFPNVFENFFIFYIACLTFSKKSKFLTSKKRVFIVLIVLLIPKFIHEYFMHYLLVQPWQIWNISHMIGFTGIIEEYINYLIWGIIFYTAPFLVFLNFIKKRK